MMELLDLARSPDAVAGLAHMVLAARPGPLGPEELLALDGW